MSGQRPGRWETPRRRHRFLTGALVIAAHVGIFVLLLWPRAANPPTRNAPPPPPPLQMTLYDAPKPAMPGPPEPTLQQPAASAVPVPHIAVTARAPQESPIKVPDNSDILSNSQLAGAASVGDGQGGGAGGGGGCDIARAVQQALRRDPMVRAAVEEAHRSGKAIMVWDGDWVRNGDQDGKGLSAVREAIMWEVGFSPAACRNTRMHGLVLLSLADGATRFAVGTGDWRWSDLLGVRSAVR